MIMHRGGFFMLERIAYRTRVSEAVIHRPNRVMSSIIEGASQNHCSLPNAGPNVEFASPLEQHSEGVITNGHGLTIYRSFLTSADSDFSIYCLLSELEKWKQAHDGNFPEAWYNQIYGGSENANQYLLAALEYLVIKRMVRKIVTLCVCADGVVSPSSEDDRAEFMLTAFSTTPDTPAQIELVPFREIIAPNIPQPAIPIVSVVVPANFTTIYDNPDTPPSIYCNMTPCGMFGKVVLNTDSDLYLAYAIECDCFDAPLFVDAQDWTHFRQKMAYCLLNQELLF